VGVFLKKLSCKPIFAEKPLHFYEKNILQEKKKQKKKNKKKKTISPQKLAPY